MWMKWHHKWASGPSSPEWLYLGAATAVDAADIAAETAQELSQEPACWSDHYRGVAYELVSSPPEHVLRDHLARAERDLERCQKRVLEIQALVVASRNAVD